MNAPTVSQERSSLLSGLPRRLFFKIFVAFWVAMAGAGVLLLGVETTRTAKLSQRWRAVTADALAIYATAAAQNYEKQNYEKQNYESPSEQSKKQSKKTLFEFLTDLEDRTSIRAWVFDPEGEEVSGYAAIERKKHPEWLRDRMTQLVNRARVSGVSEFADLEGITVAAHSAKDTQGQTLVFVGILPDARYDFWGAAMRVQILRLLGVLAAAGAVSWLLARHLTQPLDALRHMTKRLAAGDFSARANYDMRNRSDELAELTADFNGMAGRIEWLLQEKERLLSSQRHLLADVAHELRSPLARANVALELARDGLGQSEDGEDGDVIREEVDTLSVKNSLNRIERETGNLTDLIDRLLVIARLESGVQRPEFDSIDLSAMIRAVVADAHFEAQANNRQVELLHFEESLIAGTPPLLRSAIENVVRNAVRHSPEGGKVDVALAVKNDDELAAFWTTEQNGENCFVSELVALSAEPSMKVSRWAVITVRDQGPGVPTDELGQIFRPFYRSGHGRTRQSGGAGLGLTITARSMELHGGQYRLCNLQPHGLEVQLRFPVR